MASRSARLQDREPTVGVWVSLASPAVAEFRVAGVESAREAYEDATER